MQCKDFDDYVEKYAGMGSWISNTFGNPFGARAARSATKKAIDAGKESLSKARDFSSRAAKSKKNADRATRQADKAAALRNKPEGFFSRNIKWGREGRRARRAEKNTRLEALEKSKRKEAKSEYGRSGAYGGKANPARENAKASFGQAKVHRNDLRKAKNSQMAIGGTAVAAAGAGYLATRRQKNNSMGQNTDQNRFNYRTRRQYY